MRAKEINPNEMTRNKRTSKTESTSLENPALRLYFTVVVNFLSTKC